MMPWLLSSVALSKSAAMRLVALSMPRNQLIVAAAGQALGHQRDG